MEIRIKLMASDESKLVVCDRCGYSGELRTYPSCLGYHDIRCPQCRSTNNQHNRDVCAFNQANRPTNATDPRVSQTQEIVAIGARFVLECGDQKCAVEWVNLEPLRVRVTLPDGREVQFGRHAPIGLPSVEAAIRCMQLALKYHGA